MLKNYFLYIECNKKDYFRYLDMIVYHGSDRKIEHPRIMEPNRALDFGKGFYTTLNEMQANGFALKVKDRFHSEDAVVSVYEVYLEQMKAELNGMWFDEPDEAWLDYVSANRNGVPTTACDFVYGPVANDDVFRAFAAYQAGVLTKEETLARLKVKQLYNQLTFKSEKSLKYIKFLTAYSL